MRPIDIAPLLRINNVFKKNMRYHNKNSKSKNLSVYLGSKNEARWMHLTMPVSLMCNLQHPPSIFAKFARLREFAQILNVQKAPKILNWKLTKP